MDFPFYFYNNFLKKPHPATKKYKLTVGIAKAATFL